MAKNQTLFEHTSVFDPGRELQIRKFLCTARTERSSSIIQRHPAKKFPVTVLRLGN